MDAKLTPRLEIARLIIKFLGTHCAESKSTRLVSLLVDGILAIDAGSLVSELTFSEQSKIKWILLSHGHYDHIRGVPAFAFNNSSHTTKVFGLLQTLEILTSRCMDGVVYPAFGGIPNFLEKPTLELVPIEPFETIDLDGYQITAIPVVHPIDTVGFEISTKEGRGVFYTGDTGTGLSSAWQYVSPDVLIVDVTFPNRLSSIALESGHLCPKMLGDELIEFQKINKYIPRVSLIHMMPEFESEIREEATQVAKELAFPLHIPSEGDELQV
ncbi:MBL fold metallo-hydrolase [Chloroflexota bacterium]